MAKRRFIKAADVADKETSWLWDPYIPYGKVTILHGEEDVGKTMLAIRLLAACSGKVKMDRFIRYFEKCRCLYLTDEEDLASVIKPRLKLAGANLEDVLIINETFPITLADESLREIIVQNQIRLMVIDPISAYMDKEESMKSDLNYKAYPIIRKLAELAEETGCAIVLVEKSEGLDCALVREWRTAFKSSVAGYMCMIWDEEAGYEDRVLCHEFSRLTVEGEPVSYVLTSDKGLKYA